MLVMSHGIVIAGPIFSASISLSKFAVAERALSILRDPHSEKFVERLCSCRFAMQVDVLEGSDTSSDVEDAFEVSTFLLKRDPETDTETEGD